MSNFNFIKDEFIKKHEIIDDNTYLEKYINFLLTYKINNNDNVYTEKHHILPRAMFPEFENENWNIVEVTYEDHKLVHLWLFKSINIRTYQRPLNWMMNYYKNTKEISNAAKRGWKKLKSNKNKFDEFKRKRSQHMKSLTSEEQSRRANLFWKNITDEEYVEFCNSMKNIWTEERRQNLSEKLKLFYSNPENRELKSQESQKIWNNRSETDKLKFNEKMNIVNKDINKRKAAGDKIKKLWKNEEYIEKMKNRKKRGGVKLKLITENQKEIIFNTMTEFANKYNFTPRLIRKYRDTNKKISKTDLNIDNIELENCIIETIK